MTAPARGGAAPAPAPGSRLIREWRGRTHTVDVLDSGFRCDGKQYRSLSEIARAITGARWSGPRFFGSDHADPLRDLYQEVDRRRARAGVQLAPCPARSLRGLHQVPAGDGLDRAGRCLRRRWPVRRHPGPPGPAAASRRHSGPQGRYGGGLQGRPADPSLADFAKIVEVFDAHEVSLVSVTQQFNTTTSMGG